MLHKKKKEGSLENFLLFSVKKLVLTCISLTSVTIVKREQYALSIGILWELLKNFAFANTIELPHTFFQQEVLKNYDYIWSAILWA